MSVNNGIVTAPVSISEVSSLIGAGTNDLGTLCKHPNVNMWAKYKPISAAVIGELTEAKQKELCFGLSAPDGRYVSAISLSNASDIEDAISNVWVYEQPQGGASSPYRLGDFKGYYHDANPPMEAQVPSSGLTVNKSKKTYVNINIDVDPDRGGVGIYEIQGYELLNGDLDLREYEWIFLVKDPNGNYKVAGKADENILDYDGQINSTSIYIDISNFTTYIKPYDVYIGLGKFSNGRWWVIPLPNGGKSTMNKCPFKLYVTNDPISGGGGVSNWLNDVLFSYTLNGVYKTANECTDEGSGNYSMKTTYGDVYIKLTIKNTSGSSSVISGNDIEIYANERNLIAHPIIYNSSNTAVSSLTIPANGTVTCTFRFDGLLSWVTSTSVGNTVELDLRRKNSDNSLVNIWNGALRVHKGSTDGWATI